MNPLCILTVKPLFQNNTEDQNIEFGTWKNQTDGSEPKLTPLDMRAWEKRQKDLRHNFLQSELVEVKKALEEVDIDDLLHEFDKKNPEKKRRVAVFYVDRGYTGLDMVKWWIYTWKFIGLDSVNLVLSSCLSLLSSSELTWTHSPLPSSSTGGQRTSLLTKTITLTLIWIVLRMPSKLLHVLLGLTTKNGTTLAPHGMGIPGGLGTWQKSLWP